LVLAGAWGVFGLARSPLLPALGQGAANLTSHPWGQGGLLFTGGISLLLWQALALEQALAPRAEAQAEQLAGSAGPSLPKVVSAHTDAGYPLPLYPPSSKGQGPAHEISPAVLREGGLQHRVIQVGPARNDHNCHGWVFAGGRYSVPGTSIERILEDNDYQQVSVPAAGDVAIFRDPTGQVTHSALVQTVAPDGLILLESKWGLAGRYIHSPEDHIYRKDTLSYYRTGRGTHLLRGLDLPAAPPALRNGPAAEESPGLPRGEKQGQPLG
jgi:hypothetical protein